MELQLDLFEKYDEKAIYDQRLKHVETQLGNVRRGVFQRVGNLQKDIQEKEDRYMVELNKIGLRLQQIESYLDISKPVFAFEKWG